MQSIENSLDETLVKLTCVVWTKIELRTSPWVHVYWFIAQVTPQNSVYRRLLSCVRVSVQVCLYVELVYAAESYKKIIPLTLEPRYNPHGWLRFHTSDGLRYDFSNNQSFEDSFKKLVYVLKKCYSASGMGHQVTSINKTLRLTVFLYITCIE